LITWDLYESRESTVDVTKSGKAFAYDLSSKEEAIRKIKKSRFFDSRQKIIFHSKDGLRENV